MREWYWQLEEESELEGEAITELVATLFVIFYVDDAYLASRDPKFLQRAVTILVDLFARVGLETNAKKIMIFTPGRIQTQLPTASYDQMQKGLVPAEEWDSWKVQCHQCHKMMSASSLCHQLADQQRSTNVLWWRKNSWEHE